MDNGVLVRWLFGADFQDGLLVDFHVTHKLLQILSLGSHKLLVSGDLGLLYLDCEGSVTKLLLPVDCCKLRWRTLDCQLRYRGISIIHHFIELIEEECEKEERDDKWDCSTEECKCFWLPTQVVRSRALCKLIFAAYPSMNFVHYHFPNGNFAFLFFWLRLCFIHDLVKLIKFIFYL